MSSRTLLSVTNVRLVIKLTDDSTLCVHDQISVDNMSCVAIGGKPATVRNCVRQAFRLCKREKLNNIPPTMTSGMEDLLKCPGKYVEESMQELDCDHSMLVDAICTGQGTLNIGRLVIDLGTLLHPAPPRANSFVIGTAVINTHNTGQDYAVLGGG